MPQSLAVLYVHLVFSTIGRHPFLREKQLRTSLFQFLKKCSDEQGYNCIVVGGVEDHIHILARQSRTLSISAWVKELKRSSSLWLKTGGTEFQEFAWQGGYGAFSVDTEHLNNLRTYIETQEEHHRDIKFQDEYRDILRQYQEPYDERYIWE